MPDVYAAVGFLYHPDSGKVLLHHRDANAPTMPNLWAGFGGLSEHDDGADRIVTLQREMHEELGINLAREQIRPLREYVSPYSGHPHYVFFAIWPTLDDAFVLGEGDSYAWFSFEEALALPDLMDLSHADLLTLRAIVGA